MEPSRNREPGSANRVVAALLASVWLISGFAALCLGVAHARWVPVVIGPLGMWYGWLWVRVAWTGRRLDSVWPWRR
jgi:hypothetical protein